jgi:selenide,water dikinase
MGGRPLTALAIAAFPARDFDVSVIKAIFAGGLSVLQECEVALLGGHTVQDAEVKFGYAVTGVVSPSAVWTNASARAGDVLILTKALGTGIIATAAKFGRTDADVLAGALASMQQTNRSAAEALLQRPSAVHGCTDVTGFGLAGHACEMATASDVTFEITMAQVPLLPGARDLALGNRTGGLVNNRAHFGAAVAEGALPPDLLALAFDPQTSGGLLATVDPAVAAALVATLVDLGLPAAVIGRVVPAGGARVILG